jgi:hypothetical protein
MKPIPTSRLLIQALRAWQLVGGQLLEGPAVAVGIFEGGIQYPSEILYLAHVHPAF